MSSAVTVIGWQTLARKLSERAAAIAQARGFVPNVTRMSFPLSESGMADAMEFGSYRALQSLVTELSSAPPPFIRVNSEMTQADIRRALEEDTRVDVTTTEAALYIGRDPRTLRAWSKTGTGPMVPVNGPNREGFQHSRWRLDDIRRMLGMPPR